MAEKTKKRIKRIKTSGVVSNCSFLNVRQEPIETARIIQVLNGGDKVKIIPNKSVVGWHCVRLDNDVIGFCMKKFIK